MKDRTKCSFSTITERDMDMLVLEAVASDPGFTNLIIEKTALKGKTFNVVSVELSKEDSNLGESDITIIVESDRKKHGILIEDKIDAIAMPDQHDRYVKRGELGINEGDYESFSIFIFCPSSYYKKNSEAQKYENHLSYEECKKYFDSKDDAISRIKSQQIEQAIHKSRGRGETKLDPRANSFLKSYIEYQREHYPSLDIATNENANGWWIEYRTSIKYVGITQKNEMGYVDLSFPKSVKKINDLQRFAEWARSNGMPEITAVKTGKSASLRINVPKIDCKKPFEETNIEDIEKCLQAAQKLTELIEAIRIVMFVMEDKDK